ncbi:MAG: malto-oligosyltrehalose synthase [Mycobacteriaceae bacterium]
MPTHARHPVLSTYRLQMSGDAFTFSDAEKIVDYLGDLGVTHLYLSPILTAEPGSTHGYDVTDPTTVSADLGGADGLAGLAKAAHERGLGLIVDIVPNHAGIGLPQHNPWWWDVLRHGRGSRYARFFDIDWAADTQGRVVLPVLGSDADVAQLTVDGDVLRCYSMSFPIAPGTGGGDPTAVHDRQHYKLVGWRSGVCGYRRFFSVTSLAGLRQEDPAVFDASHTEVARWFAEGLVDGLRVDHPDGLTDPAGYLTRLRDLVGPQAWIVIEKILAAREPLDPSLPVDGTTGYDALREIGGVFIDPNGADSLTALIKTADFHYRDAQESLRQLKIDTTTNTLASELARLCRTVEHATGAGHPRLPAAIAALLSAVGVYRSDYRVLSQVLGAAMATTIAAEPDLAAPLEILASALTHPEPAARLQQLCGAMTAKAVEDCYFYRDARLVSLNEVGGDPRRFGVSAAEFHRAAAVRADLWPHTMTTLSTHDTKRGEDVRARIGVLSQVPNLWSELVHRWESASPSPDLLTGLFLWQNIFGVWPADGRVSATLRKRLHSYAEKALREAGRRTSWQDPDEDFERAVHGWLDSVLDGPPAAELTEFLRSVQPPAQSDALGQKLLALTVPGIPDVYQGTELWEDSLVDPDNRRPVDYADRRAALHRLEHPKLRVVAAALGARRERPESFLRGGYRPALASGPAAEHLLAFLRGDDVLVAVSRWTLHLAEIGWGATSLELPLGTWRDRITGVHHHGPTPAAELFGELPVALLERTDG